MFSLRRASSRLLLSSAPVYQQERQLLLSVTASTTRPHIRSISSAATLPTTIATATTTTSAYECPIISSLNNVTIRSKHSSTQIKRLFKKNPARRRILQKELLLNNNNNNSSEGEEATAVQKNQNIIPQSQIQPVILEPNILSNGWNAQTNVEISHYPFQVARTKNKPNDAVGFLPVYSEFR